MEKINVAELLRDCPTGMELDSPMYDNLYFGRVEEDHGLLILCYTIYHGNKTAVYFTEFGSYNTHKTAKCVIFPKGKTTWEGFQRPFKDGDILATNLGSVFYLNTRLNNDEYYGCYVGIGCDDAFHICEPFAYKECCGFATEKEKEKLFKAIKDKGYKWNAETKTLQKLVEPKFKVGDRIIKNNGIYIFDIVFVSSEYYTIQGFGSVYEIPIKELQDNYELVPSKFDINTLVPFESRVLVRDHDNDTWRASFWGCLINSEYGFRYDTTRGCYKQCIPYKGNEHLLGKTDDCDNYYKTW